MPNIVNEIKLDFKDVLLRPKRSTIKSRNDVNLYRKITFRNSKQVYNGIPVMASNMDTVGTFQMAKVLSKHGLFTCIHKYYSIEEWKAFAEEHPDVVPNIAASSGMADNDFNRLSETLKAVPQVSFICLDVANGYSQHFVDYVKQVRAAFPTHTIIAGNVVTGEMVEELILSGADIIKVGIGPGSVCTTRMKTGVGYPQLSAVIECADAAHGLQGHIISDGGCTCAGDVAKAFGAGADFVMAGGMFAGHDQCDGDIIEKDGKKLKLFYGMSSNTAMKKHAGGVAEYRSSEGKTVEVPYKGDVEGTILDILGGLRSACTYTGAEPKSCIHPNNLTLYKAQIRPSLEYCSHVWSCAPKHTLRLMDSIQRRAIRLIGDQELTNNLDSEDRASIASLASMDCTPLIATQYISSFNIK